MTTTRRFAILLAAALASACAGARNGRGKAPEVMHQADERIPPLAAFEPGDLRTSYNQALAYEQRGWRAESAGNLDEAREPLEAAARGYLGFLERFPNTGWDVTFQYHAADLLRRAGKADEAAAIAQRLAEHPAANPKSRAMAWLQAANSLTAAGKLEPMRIDPRPPASEGEAAAPKPLPAPWRRFVESTDAYLQGLGETEEPEDRILSAGQLALVAGRVAYATDDMEGARSRLATILERWSSEPAVFQGAAPLYVQTFLATGDDEGAAEAVEHVREIARSEAQMAQSQDARAVYEKIGQETERIAAGVMFERAKALLEQGNAPEAAQAFEAAAQEGGDVASALSGAAIAWDRAGNAERAAELRRRIVEEHGDSKVAPGAALQLAAYLSKQGDHGAAGDVYGMHAERWPEDPNHCTALRNGAVELDLAKEVQPAAERYRAFAREERCAGESPDVAALALYRAGQLFLSAKQRGEAREAFEAAAAIEGVQTPEAQKRVADAKVQARKLGKASARRPPAK